MRTSSAIAVRPRERVLVVDERRRPPPGLEDVEVCTGAEAYARVAERVPEVVVWTGPAAEVARLRERAPGAVVLVLAEAPSVADAVAALRAGAADYLTDPAGLPDAVARARAPAAADPVPDTAARHGFLPTLTRNPRMLRVFDAIRAVARTDATVLVRGESGTGAGLVARAIHGLSRRADGPLVRVSCATLGDGLGRELFGEPGRRGAFEQAERGTLVLDELGEPPAAVQVALLRALEEHRVRRAGGDPVRVDARVVVTTPLDLAASVAEGRIREDLYYRLDVFPIVLPALRERPEDVPLLVAHFLADAARAYGLEAPVVTPDALAMLQRYRWPGNVRQLRALCERWVVQCAGGTLGLDALPAEISGARPPAGPALHIDDTVPLATLTERVTQQIERAYLEKLLTRLGGHLQNTAAAAGITRRTLYTRMKELGLDAKDYK